MHRYRSHTCGALRDSDIGQTARLSGWCHRIRDHGGVLFIDLRDHYGITQVVADPDSPSFKHAEKLFFGLVETDKVDLIAALHNERKTSQHVKASTLDDRVFTDGKINFAKLFPVLINNVINPSIPDRQRKEIRGHPDSLSGERRRKQAEKQQTASQIHCKLV